MEEMECLKGKNEINKSHKDFQPRMNMCRNKDGTIMSSEETILQRWNEHFDELLNEDLADKQCNLPSVNTCRRETEREFLAPDSEEVELAIQMLKDNKAPGTDLTQS